MSLCVLNIAHVLRNIVHAHFTNILRIQSFNDDFPYHVLLQGYANNNDHIIIVRRF
mgnify:FL=1